MAQTLTRIAQILKDSTHTVRARNASSEDVTVQLIYAFNGIGKTRLSREFKELIAPKNNEDEGGKIKVLYYNAFTEDLFFWDNDLLEDTKRKLKIQSNTFTKWVLADEGQENNIAANFQHHTNDKLTPTFNEKYTYKDKEGKDVIVEAYSEVTFSLETGDDQSKNHIKISKGEESCFIWSIFYCLLRQVIEVLNVPEPDDRSTDKFNDLEYVFIDDPVSSLDENHLIELAVALAKLIKSSQTNVKFIVTTHNPLFYNVLHNELKDGKYKKYILNKLDDGTFKLTNQPNDSPFSYHLLLKREIENAIIAGSISKYHFNFLRNILEKTSTFLGRNNWGDLLPERTPGERDSYLSRIINISSHSKHSSEETFELTDDNRRILEYIMNETEIFQHFRN